MKLKINSFNRFSIKKYALLIVILMLPFILSGCWNYNELVDLAIILSAAIDKNNDGTFTLTMEIVSFNSNSNDNSSAGKSAGSESKIVTSNGDTIYEAISNVSNIVGKTAYWDHARIVVLSNKLNGEDFKRVLDCLLRNNETNINTKLFVSQTENAYDVYKAKSEFHNFLAFDIYSTQNASNTISESIDIDLFQVVDEYGYAGASIALPAININHKDDSDYIVISGMGIFNKEKFVCFIPEKDSMFYLFAINKVNYGEISIKTNDDPENNANISLRIVDTKTKINPQILDNKFKVTYDIDIKYMVTGYSGKQNFSTKEDIIMLERICSEYLSNNIEKFIKKMQGTYETDILNLSKLYRGKYYKEWLSVRENWKSTFKHMDFEVNVSSKIINSGAIVSIIKES